MKPMWDGMGLLGVGLGLLWVATCVEATGGSFGYEGRSGEHCVCKCTPKPSPPPHAPSLSPPPSSPPPPPKPKKLHAYPPPPSPTLPLPPPPPPTYTPPPPPTYTPPPSPYLPPTPHLFPPPPSPITKPKPPPPQTCSSANLAKIQVCSPLLGLGGLNLGVVIGGGVSPAQKSQCCALLDLLGLDAEVCLCAAIDLNALGLVGVHAKIDLVVKVFTDCGRTAPKLKACP